MITIDFNSFWNEDKDLTPKQKGFILGEGETLHSVAIIGFTLAFQVI